MTSLVRTHDRNRMPALVGWQPWFDNFFFTPPTRIHDADDDMTLTVDMPGVDPRDVDLTFTAGTLQITGTRGERTYRYVATLGNAVDPDRIEAALHNGVLTIRAHKREAAKPRKIAINGARSEHTPKPGLLDRLRARKLLGR